jgi:polysaccharide pyruvyl transferase WcaK-like protein
VGRVTKADTRGRGPAAHPRVGLFGLLGDGNTGNDASTESLMLYLRTEHPGAIVDAMCTGTARLTREYGITAVPLYWQQNAITRLPKVARLPVLACARLADAFRIASWVGRHEVVIVPGTGVLEASLPIRPWETPFAMFILSVSGRLLRTKVALVSVGATTVDKRATKWLLNSAARMSFYCSYRDDRSKAAMADRGVRGARYKVYRDLVYGLAPPPYQPGDPGAVAVGVMTYSGTNNERKNAGQIHAAYLAAMKAFVAWLVEHGRTVRLVVGDKADDVAVQEILADVRSRYPDLDPAVVTAAPATSYADLVQTLMSAGAVVSTRFHNVLWGLKLTRPVVSLGYALKNLAVMEQAGLGDYCQDASSVDLDLLIRQFTELEERWGQLRPVVAERTAASAALVAEQFDELSEVLFGRSAAGQPAPGLESSAPAA